MNTYRLARLWGLALVLAGSATLATAPTVRAAGLLAQLETEIQKLAADLSASVVTIRSIRIQNEHRELREVYVGTGVVFDSGWVITTSSVVASGVAYSVEAPGQVPVPAELVEYNQDGQTAVFRAPGLIAAPARFQERTALIPGQMLLVMGNAYGVQGAVAWGMAAGQREDGSWQVGVSISPGASGSPVINTAGEVVGLISAALSDVKTPQVSLFGGHTAVMIPAERVLGLAQRVVSEGHVGRAFLGVRPATMSPTLSQALGLTHGVLIGAVSFGSPAYGVGLRSGDVIIEMDAKPIVGEQSLRAGLAEHCPGEEIDLVIVRHNEISQLTVRLGQVPEILPARPAAYSGEALSVQTETAAAGPADELEAEIELLEKRLKDLKDKLERP